MDTKNTAKEYRLAQWGQVMRERADSGQTIKDYCDMTGINRNTYFYWQKKLREAACTELAKTEVHEINVPNGWMQLTSKQVSKSSNSLEIEISGCCITVTAATDHELLKKVCCTLRSI